MTNPQIVDEISPDPTPSEPETPPSKSTSAGRTLLKAATFMAVLLLASKLLGFGRDWLLVKVYGLSLASDAYFAAFQLPQFSLILLGGMGGPFHTATVSIFSKLLDRHHPDDVGTPSLKAKQLSGVLCTLMALVFGGLSLLAYWFAQPIMTLILGSKASPLLIASATAQLQVMAPIISIGALVGFLYGSLNLLQVYIWPALSPAIMSLVMIIALLVFPADSGGMLLAYSSLLGAFLQLALQLPEYLKKGFSLKPSLEGFKDPKIREWFELLWPAMLGTTIGQGLIYVDMAFLQFLPEGGWSAVVLTNRLIQLPIGVLQTALLVPLFPRMVKLVDEKRLDELDDAVVTSIGGLWFVTLPLMVLFIFFSGALVSGVFQHGAFDASDVSMVTLALLYQSFQMIPYFARDTLTRVFYAFGDTRTPLIVGILAIGFKALFNWLFIVQWMNLGVGGLTLSVTLITTVNWFLLSVLLKRGAYPSLPTGRLLSVLGKLLVAVVPMAAVGYAVHQPWALPLVSWLPKTSLISPWGVPVLQVLLTLVVGAPAYWVVSHTLKVPGIEGVQQRVLAKLLRR